MTLSDGQLLAAFRGGDASAFGALVTAHEATLLRHARAILGPGSHHEDVVQEVFIKLAQSPPVLPDEVDGDPRLERMHVSSWLHKVTRNGCMDLIRSEGRRKRRERDAAGEIALAGGSSDDGFAAAGAGETRAIVERELARLPIDQREVLVLRLLNEKSYAEIAEITGRKVGTVGWLISVGLKTLSQELAPLLGEAPRAARAAPESRIGLAQGEV